MCSRAWLKNILNKEYLGKNILCSKNMCALVLGQGGDDARAVVSSRNQAFSVAWPSWRRIFCAILIGCGGEEYFE